MGYSTDNLYSDIFTKTTIDPAVPGSAFTTFTICIDQKIEWDKPKKPISLYERFKAWFMR